MRRLFRAVHIVARQVIMSWTLAFIQYPVPQCHAIVGSSLWLVPVNQGGPSMISCAKAGRCARVCECPRDAGADIYVVVPGHYQGRGRQVVR